MERLRQASGALAKGGGATSGCVTWARWPCGQTQPIATCENAPSSFVNINAVDKDIHTFSIAQCITAVPNLQTSGQKSQGHPMAETPSPCSVAGSGLPLPPPGCCGTVRYHSLTLVPVGPFTAFSIAICQTQRKGSGDSSLAMGSGVVLMPGLRQPW